jgi:catechol 2,3-dioxygenase-like lactoylglutathione lyase family enzyme
MEMKLELVILPVSDVDRAKAFYERVGFHTDHDQAVSDEIRFVQQTPPGSACSIAFGRGLTDATPGSVKGLQMVIADAAAMRAALLDRGIDASEVDEQPWGSFVYFADPDGNAWTLQQLPAWSLGAGGDGVRPETVG